MASKSEYKDPIPKLTGAKFTSGTYRGAYSAVNFDPTFAKSASKDSFESSGVVGAVDAPDVGGVDEAAALRNGKGPQEPKPALFLITARN